MALWSLLLSAVNAALAAAHFTSFKWFWVFLAVFWFGDFIKTELRGR